MPTKPTPSSCREKVNKCHKKTYKEALTGKISHKSQSANLDESDFPSFIPSGLAEEKIVWPSKVTNQENKLQNKILEPEKPVRSPSSALRGEGESEKTKPEIFSRPEIFPRAGCRQARNNCRQRGPRGSQRFHRNFSPRQTNWSLHQMFSDVADASSPMP